ncbi:TOM1-like protein 5 [Vicia villosa]|uniref:TOM1-like protein 5 n=1 Tax=Vicia villosa TaxID=3911 RepID=UPI00273B6CE2|nr:TOM1-like protein 5 [Vicia villosa]XP_058786455.1 TOM1-like protein 5 [Vicia villosa]
MAAELVNAATSDKLSETDWARNIEICELVARDKRQARDVVKAIKKKLGSKHPNTQLYAVTLLEMLMNNTGEHIHEQVIDIGIIPILVKIVKKKSDLPVRERIFLLLDATQSSLGGASGKFPQYYHAYYDLVNAGVQFTQSAQVVESNHASSQPSSTGSIPNREQAPPRLEAVVPQAESKTVPESSIIQKAGNALEVLKEVLDAVDAQHPQGASDEFTLDLVEQCSFQKQRVMHLVMASRDERTVSRAIELNEQLQKVLARHEDLVSGRTTTTTANEQVPEVLPRHDNIVSGRVTTTSNEQFPKVLPRRGDLVSGRVTTNANEQLPKVLPKRDDVVSGRATEAVATHFDLDESEEEEEAEQLVRRLRKGKACARPEDEQTETDISRMRMNGERLNRPLIRPLSSEPSREAYNPAPPPALIPPPRPKQTEELPHVAIPPPPAKHIEREKFFQENKDASNLSGHVRGLSLHSRNGSSSRSGSFDFRD